MPQPPAAVLRGRLFDRLDVGSDGLLTLLTGPAGAGKTVLMSTWLSERPHADPVVWISMQPSDGRPVRFWGELIRRLRDIFDEPLNSLPDPDDGLSDDFGSRFATGAEGLPEPVLVVLDDFEQAQSRALADSFDLFLRGRQQRLRLLIASRHDPSVALQRLRLAGQLTELRATDLVMTPDESRELLQAPVSRLPTRMRRSCTNARRAGSPGSAWPRSHSRTTRTRQGSCAPSQVMSGRWAIT